MKAFKFALAAGIAASAMAALPAYAQFTERNIRLSNGVNEDHPNGKGVEKFKACLTDKSGGKMKVQGFWGNALGGDLQATQALRSGTQEMVVTSSSPLIGILPELGVFDLPFLFANEKEADTVLDGEFGKHVDAKLETVGLVNLAYWENGFRNLTNSRRPVEKWEDFKGLKVRVMQNNVFLDTFKNMGANAVPMAFGEVFTALGQAIAAPTPVAGAHPLHERCAAGSTPRKRSGRTGTPRALSTSARRRPVRTGSPLSAGKSPGSPTTSPRGTPQDGRRIR